MFMLLRECEGEKKWIQTKAGRVKDTNRGMIQIDILYQYDQLFGRCDV
jgi:hypothetical protein